MIYHFNITYFIFLQQSEEYYSSTEIGCWNSQARLPSNLFEYSFCSILTAFDQQLWQYNILKLITVVWPTLLLVFILK